ncbi:MAG: hypothetical protein AABX65_00725 [Nanoarchaeota archaeon]
MQLPSKIRFADEKLQEEFEKLKTGNSEEQEIVKFIERAFLDIENNAFCGIQIPKKLIPAEYFKKYNITNLWKYNLPNAWRLIYSIENQQICVVSIILEWMNHKEYERRFDY